MHITAELPIDSSDARSPVQDGRQAARIFALTAAVLFGVIFVLQAVSFRGPSLNTRALAVSSGAGGAVEMSPPLASFGRDTDDRLKLS